eukprot:m.8993 g.8993  ORF g.8993 m.8993 type:complete len:197 (+) comp5350_c0_seq1:383-973(+)
MGAEGGLNAVSPWVLFSDFPGSRFCSVASATHTKSQTQSLPVLPRKMPKNILVCADNSPASFDALNWATTNMYQADDVLHLVHCYKPLQPAVGPHYAYVPSEAEQNSWKEEQKKILLDFIAKAKEANADVKIEAHLVAGDPRDEIVLLGEKINAAAIVVGSRGHGAIKRAFLGSVSTHLSHHSPRPLVIIHHKDAK